MRSSYVYILASKRNGTLYIGVTAHLKQRLQQHRVGAFKQCFSYRYNINILVYYEGHRSIFDAIAREKQLKRWRRVWKIQLIESINPEWDDLTPLIGN